MLMRQLIVLIVFGTLGCGTSVKPQDEKAHKDSPAGIPSSKKGHSTSEVTAKEIETFGEKLTGQRCELVCKFRDVSDTWVKLLLNDDSYVGIFVTDSKGVYFQYAFADKEKYARQLIQMKKNEPLRLIGKVEAVGSKYVLMVEEIRQ